MNKEEALSLLKDAPRDQKPSRVNKSLTCEQAVDIVTQGIESAKSTNRTYFKRDGSLTPLMEKRVCQVVQNRRRPRSAQ